jgi:hypothetical protein
MACENRQRHFALMRLLLELQATISWKLAGKNTLHMANDVISGAWQRGLDIVIESSPMLEAFQRRKR